MGVSQTDAIVVAFLVAFIVFIVIKGQLPQYLAVLGF